MTLKNDIFFKVIEFPTQGYTVKMLSTDIKVDSGLHFCVPVGQILCI